MHLPCPRADDLAFEPELASLALLDAAVAITIQALIARNPELLLDGDEGPRPPEQVFAARPPRGLSRAARRDATLSRPPAGASRAERQLPLLAMVPSQTSLALRVLAELNSRELLPIVREVCRLHGVTLDEVCGLLRSRSVGRARQEAWWRVRHHPERHYSLGDVARIFGKSRKSITGGVRAQARRLAAHPAPDLPGD